MGSSEPTRVLRGRDYRHADLSSADLAGLVFAKNYRFPCTDLRLATLSGIHLMWTDLRRAVVRGADIRATTFVACDLRDADLRDTDMRDVRFAVAHAAGGRRPCNLEGARMDGADLRGATYVPETIWPSDVDPEARGASQE